MQSMNNFIKECEYFTFAIFDGVGTQDIIQILDNENYPKKTSEISNFNALDYLMPQLKSGLIKRKFYLFNPYNEIVVMITNKEDGINSIINIISKKLRIKSYSISFSQNTNIEAKNEILILDSGQIIRIIYAMRDPNWIFYQQGDILDFEKIDYYKNRYIKNRLNKKILIEYCNALGFFILEESFWHADRALFVEYL